jgi:predicted ABC-type ATPase
MLFPGFARSPAEQNGADARSLASNLRTPRRLYLPLADSALIYDNASARGTLIAERKAPGELIIYDPTKWKAIEEART